LSYGAKSRAVVHAAALTLLRAGNEDARQVGLTSWTNAKGGSDWSRLWERRLDGCDGDQRGAFRQFALLAADKRSRTERPLLGFRHRTRDSVVATFSSGFNRAPYIHAFIEKGYVNDLHGWIKPFRQTLLGAELEPPLNDRPDVLLQVRLGVVRPDGIDVLETLPLRNAVYRVFLAS